MSDLAHQDKETVNSPSAVTHASSIHSVHDPALSERRVWRKLDLYVLPVVVMIYLLCFLVGRRVYIAFQYWRLLTGPYEHRECPHRRPPRGPQDDRHSVLDSADHDICPVHRRRTALESIAPRESLRGF